MGHEKSGIPLDAKTVAAMRAFWLASGRNALRTATKYAVDRRTVANYRKEQDWDAWADKVETETDARAVITQAERRVKLLALIDKRVDALDSSASNPVVQGSVATEIQKLAQTGELLTGGPTDRLAVDGFWDGWAKKSDDEKREFLAELRRRIAGPDSADGESGSTDQG